MTTTTRPNEGTLLVALSGKLDATTSAAFEKQIQLDGIQSLILDFNGCDYISSLGLRLILAAHQKMSAKKGAMTLIHVSPEVYSIFETTGLSKVIAIKRKMREISIEGLQFISAGVGGECYRLDQDTVVKLYHEGVDASVAEQEKQSTQAAFLMGIPTAISYDVVSCGNRTGIVFEMLNAEIFSTVIKNDYALLDQHAKTLSDVAKTLHSAKGDPAILTNLKTRFRDYIPQMGEFLPPEDVALLMRNLESVPDSETCVHFDLHSSNIMIQDGKPTLIDMGDFSIGSYLFDIGIVYTLYGVEELALTFKATKIPNEKGPEIWKSFEKHYFADKPDHERAFFHNNRYFLASLRVIYVSLVLPYYREDCLKMLKDILMPRIRSAHSGDRSPAK